jgi:hypothetical protein
MWAKRVRLSLHEQPQTIQDAGMVTELIRAAAKRAIKRIRSP